MNQRINELVEQAGINIVPRRPYIDEEPDGYLESDNDFLLNNRKVAMTLLEGEALKKFAELIVRECMTIGFNTVYKVDDDRNAVEVYQNIKTHFGVE